MLIYILINVVLISLGLLTYSKQNKRWAIIASFLLLLFFAGFRGDFTSDYNAYSSYFLRIRQNETLWEVLSPTRGYSMEKGFVLLLRLTGYITQSPVIMFTIVAALTLFFYYCSFVKLSSMPMLTILLFVTLGDFYASFNLTRQILVAAICTLGICLFIEGKKWICIICILVAAQMHRTVLAVLPLLWFMDREINRQNVLLLSIVGILGVIVLPTIVGYTQRLFPVYSNYTYGMGEGTINAVIPQLGMILFVIYSILWGDCDFDYQERGNRILINCAILATILQFLGIRIYIISRLSYYLKPSFYILIPRIIVAYRQERERRIILICVSLVCIVFSAVVLSGTGYVPYYLAIG